MTKEWYIEFRRDQSRDMMELYYEYYKLMGGSLSRFEFDRVFPEWVILKAKGVFGFIVLQEFIFKKLDQHFVV